MAMNGRQKRSKLHNRGEFLHNYYMFEPMHDGDHDGVARILVGLSCELGGLIVYLINCLRYEAQFLSYQECNCLAFTALV